MHLIDLPSSAPLRGYKRTAILIQSPEGFIHHCDAIVLEETETGFRLLCAEPCEEALGRTFHAQRQGFQNPTELCLLAEGILRVKQETFGYLYSGGYREKPNVRILGQS